MRHVHISSCRRRDGCTCLRSPGILHRPLCGQNGLPPNAGHALPAAGDTGMGWADIAPMLAPDLPNTQFVFPTAPTVSARAAGPRHITQLLYEAGAAC